MSEIATTPNRLHRIRYTPMRDVLRGRFTGRLDVRQHIARSGLPEPARQLIERVIRRTHLRPFEKLDVANELIAHFADGLEAGKSSEELIQSFGDERQAARLIGRAKRRNRSMLAHIQTFAGRGIIALVIFYTLLGFYFFSGKASEHLPIEELNRRAEQYPPDERGWPLYEKAASVQDVALAAEILRQAAQKPIIGYTMQSGTEAEEAAKNTIKDGEFTALYNGWPNSEFLNAIYDGCWNLYLDAEHTRRDNNRSGNLIPDIDALDQICHQWHGDPAVGARAVVAMPFSFELDEIDRTLDKNAQLFSDADLQHFARRINVYRNAADLVDLRFAQIEFEEWTSANFTNGGIFSGHLTPAGLNMVIGPKNWVSANTVWRRLIQPAMFIVTPSRSKVSKGFEDEIAKARVRYSLPYRLAGWKLWDGPSKENESLFPALRIRSNTYASLQECAQLAEEKLGHRDGVLVGIALERYRRLHHAYPDSLNQLVPDFLQEIPADRYTGDPVRYRIFKGKPIVYSVGQDGHDDGGVVVWVGPYGAQQPDGGADTEKRGDWLLYPTAGELLE